MVNAKHFTVLLFFMTMAGAAGAAESPPPASAKALASYVSLFGDEDKRVLANHNSKEAARFAAKLMDASKSVGDDKDFGALLCTKAYEFGAKDSEGYPTAINAMNRLAELDKSLAADCHAKIIEIYRLQYRSATGEIRKVAGAALIAQTIDEGDEQDSKHAYPNAIKRYREALGIANEIRSTRVAEINAKIKSAGAKKIIMDRVDQLATKASTDANASHELVGLLIGDLDDPATVARFPGVVEPDKSMATLAAKPATDLSEAECLSLANWYHNFADRASVAGKATVLGHSRDLYQNYLQAHKAQDADRLGATVALDKVVKAMAALGGVFTADGIVIWNGHNGPGHDRGSKMVSVTLLNGGQVVWKRDGLPINWLPEKSVPLSVSVPRVVFDTVKVDISQWQGSGACLDAIQVLRGDKDLARGCKVKVSGGWSPAFTGAELTDGVLDKQKYFGGYWDAPDAVASWVEVTLNTAHGSEKPPH